MGRAKEWMEIEGETLVARTARIVGSVAGTVVVAARAGQALPALPSGVVTVHDTVADAGPLAGMAAGLAALRERGCRAAVVAACDYPRLAEAFLLKLIEWLGEDAGVVPHDGERMHPLIAVYRIEAGEVAARLLAGGERRVGRLVEDIGARIVPAEELRAAGAELRALCNVNEPSDWGVRLEN